MCYAIPGKVKKIEGRVAFIDYFGEEKKAFSEFFPIKPGDYVYAQGGYVIQKVTPTEAKEILTSWKDVFFELQQEDLRLSRLNLKEEGIDRKVSVLLDRALEAKPLKKDDLLYLLGLTDDRSLDLMFKAANFHRQKYLKNSCCVHGIIEISNECQRSCQYCGIAATNSSVDRYKMTPDEIVLSAKEAVQKYGFKALVFQSGETHSYSMDELVYVIKKTRELGALVFISFGEIGIDNLRVLYKAGARGLLMRFETSNEALYKKVHPGQNLKTRLAHLREAYKMGYLILTGSLIGLPGETDDDIINDIHLAKELNAEMYSFGPFIPHPKTPLAKVNSVSETLVLKVLALARLIGDKEAKILITTAFETLSPNARRLGLLAGANSVMLNVTPISYRKKYSIYPKRAHEGESIQKQVDETILLLKSLGRAPTDLGVKIR